MIVPSLPSPSDSAVDLAVAALSTALLVLAAISAFAVASFHLLSRRRRRLVDLNSLWPSRLLLALFAAAWSTAELFRVSFVRRILIPRRPYLLCLVHPFAAHAVAEPAFLSTLLLLLRASTSKSVISISTPFLVALPFVIAHVLFLYLPISALRLLGFPESHLLVASDERCAYPPYAAFFLAALAAAYVPLFVSVCWGAVAVVINKRLRVRLYALAAAVLAALPVQVVALALDSVWFLDGAAATWLHVAEFFAAFSCAAAGLSILVLHPVLDALAVADEAKEVDLVVARGSV
ncbi:uncharacterized protein [Typha latifolia]|uniref:uncharacterized protein n=1 Tax=Typha latifolia TaxID=4733 RepID=UPI003C2D2F51